MGMSTDGQVCYGVVFDDGYEFPWDDYDDIEEWWLKKVNKFKPSVEIWNSEGNYIGGVRPPEAVVDAYYTEKKKFAESVPLPVELVNYCSADYPCYMLAVPSTVRTASRGNPTKLSPESLQVKPSEIAALTEFCEKYGLTFIEGPDWFLTSYWG